MPVDMPMTITLGNYQLSFTATVSAGADGANGVTAQQLPAWPGAMLGNTIDDTPYYAGTTGKPALYQDIPNPDVPHNDSQRDTVTLSGITVKDLKSGLQVNSGYGIVMADAESSGLGEGFTWSSDQPLNAYQEVTIPGGEPPCTAEKAGLGTNTVTCKSAVNASGKTRGIMMVQAESPTTISSSFVNATASTSRQGVAFAVVFSKATGTVDVTQDGGSDGQFNIAIDKNGDPQGTSPTTGKEGGSEGTSSPQFITGTDTKINYTVTKPSGDTPINAYDISWACTIDGKEASTDAVSISGTTASVKVTGNQVPDCKATVIAKGPSTHEDSQTVNPGVVAHLKPVKPTTKGNGEITDVKFDNGEKTKVVPGEGTWTIELKDGQPVATFTPEKDDNGNPYTGKVTQQSYTVTDEYGLTATSTLDVNINVPPTTGPGKIVTNPTDKALDLGDLKTTPGNGTVEKAVFDNGQTTKETDKGTWKIELVDGKAKATFTPKDATVTGQIPVEPYTITDTNGLTASSDLNVFINTPPQANPDHQTIKPGETATLTPETIPGTGDLTTVTLDNGETTKHVPGEGTWKIELVDGKVVSTFTPDDPAYTGKVTPQAYTVTDVNGLKATSTLSVDIVTDPVTPTPSGEQPVAPNSPDESKLARTGLEVGAWATGALALVAAGLAGVIAARRKRA